LKNVRDITFKSCEREILVPRHLTAKPYVEVENNFRKTHLCN